MTRQNRIARRQLKIALGTIFDSEEVSAGIKIQLTQWVEQQSKSDLSPGFKKHVISVIDEGGWKEVYGEIDDLIEFIYTF